MAVSVCCQPSRATDQHATIIHDWAVINARLSHPNAPCRPPSPVDTQPQAGPPRTPHLVCVVDLQAGESPQDPQPCKALVRERTAVACHQLLQPAATAAQRQRLHVPTAAQVHRLQGREDRRQGLAVAVDAAGHKLADVGKGVVGWTKHVQLQLVERQQLLQGRQLAQALQVAGGDGEGQRELVQLLQPSDLQGTRGQWTRGGAV